MSINIYGDERKLIYVLNSYSEDEASHFAHLTHLLCEMVRQGCQITIVVEKMHSPPKTENLGINVIGLRNKKPMLRHIELFFVLIRLIRSGYARSFYRINAPACIIGALAHGLLGGKTYLWQSGTTHEVDWAQPFGFAKFKWWIRSFLPNWFARKLTTHFVTGPELMVDYYHKVVGIPYDKIRMLYNDIEIKRFAKLERSALRSAYLASRNLPSHTTVLLIVHRLSPVRRTLNYLEPLLEALKLRDPLLPWHLIIAGGGSELDAAIRIAKQMDASSNVNFLGDVPNRDLPTIYSYADIFLQPSFTEGFPRVMLEAMAASLPIVSTDAGGTRQLVGPIQAAYIVPKELPSEFVTTTLNLIDSHQCWEIVGKENRQHVERFSTLVVAKMYIEVLFK